MKAHIMRIGVAVAALAVVLGTVGAALEWWWLVVLVITGLLGLSFLVGLDADRVARRTRVEVARVGARGVAIPSPQEPTPAQPAPVDEPTDELLSTIRILQAQYVNRMDDITARLEADPRPRGASFVSPTTADDRS